MLFFEPRALANAHIVEPTLGAQRAAVAQIKPAFNSLLRLARANWIFAICEISKGVVIIAIGDMVIADDLGEVIRIVATALPEMRGVTRRLHRDDVEIEGEAASTKNGWRLLAFVQTGACVERKAATSEGYSKPRLARSAVAPQRRS